MIQFVFVHSLNILQVFYFCQFKLLFYALETFFKCILAGGQIFGCCVRYSSANWKLCTCRQVLLIRFHCQMVEPGHFQGELQCQCLQAFFPWASRFPKKSLLNLCLEIRIFPANCKGALYLVCPGFQEFFREETFSLLWKGIVKKIWWFNCFLYLQQYLVLLLLSCLAVSACHKIVVFQGLCFLCRVYILGSLKAVAIFSFLFHYGLLSILLVLIDFYHLIITLVKFND